MRNESAILNWNQRDYGIAGQYGLEGSIELYIDRMTEVFHEVKRVLRPEATLWLNIGDSYAGSGKGRTPRGHHSVKPGDKQATNRGSVAGVIPLPGARMHSKHGDPGHTSGQRVPQGLKPKDLCLIPARLMLALQADGWYIRRDNIWAKPNNMPESCHDRATASHEYVYQLSKSRMYFFDQEAVAEPVTGNAHDRGQGTYSKIKSPAGWDLSVGWGAHVKKDGNYTRTFRNGKQNKTYAKSVVAFVDRRNLRDVWWIPTESFPGELCLVCDRYYQRMPKSGRCACGSTKWLGHFATFPQRLVEIPVLAGTSERGCCSHCYAPWVRVVEKRYTDDVRSNGPRVEIQRSIDDFSVRYDERKLVQVRTLRWEPSCTCGMVTGMKPCLVLDPFMGAGTTALVSARLNRRFVGIELHPKYARMAECRIAYELAQGKLW